MHFNGGGINRSVENYASSHNVFVAAAAAARQMTQRR